MRAKRKIRDARIPYVVPEGAQLVDRLPSVLSTLYLVFNEGYSATAGDALVRRELCAEAIRLARVLRRFMPDEPEVAGLLGLMLLQDSRRDARTTAAGDLVLLGDQDRGLWDRDKVEEGLRLVLGLPPGPYALQAAIAAEHASAERAADTDWTRIADLYGLLVGVTPSPVIELNRAVAVAMVDGPAPGLDLIERIEGLDRYHLLHAARGDLLARLGRADEAAAAYRRALELASQPVERRFLEGRLSALEPG